MKYIYRLAGYAILMFVFNACQTPKTVTNSKRGNIQHSASYVVMNEYIIDKKHHLMWENEQDSIERSFTVAQKSCGNLILAGHNDWRLPSVKEVVSILDYTHDRNLYPIDAFTYKIDCHEGGFCNSYIWTSTMSKISMGSDKGKRIPIQINVFTGEMFTGLQTGDMSYSKCVRNN